MVAHPDLVTVLMEQLLGRPPVPVVIDPVLATSTGAPLLLAGSRRAVYRELARLRPVLTPNLPELGILTGRPPAQDEAEEIRQSELVLAWGASAVLVKGGHRDGSVYDLLVTADGEEHTFHAQRLLTHARGKGCRLASALATHLAHGLSLLPAVGRARELVRRHLEAHPG
jgi:hydroxymethylpyrimidine/phosphomethylpyrimidine kinase